jgi:hypothetical protein
MAALHTMVMTSCLLMVAFCCTGCEAIRHDIAWSAALRDTSLQILCKGSCMQVPVIGADAESLWRWD